MALADQLRALPLELEGADVVVAAAAVIGYALDDGFSAILELPDMVSLRRLLTTERVVSNRRL